MPNWNIPNITDVSSITRILYDMGAQVRTIDKSTLEIDPRKIHTCVASYELAKHIRDRIICLVPFWDAFLTRS